MKVTGRQQEFVNQLVDLYRELNGPIHYSILAERLGVSPFSAYDMLRLLEEKGLVRSEYQLSEGKSGPGRSEIVYFPTERAHQLMEQISGEVGEDWEAIKQRVLQKVIRGEFPDRDVAEAMLARIPPDEPEVLRYCVEVMTVVALRLRRGTGRQILIDYLPELLPDLETATQTDLTLLGGFALGVLATENAEDREWMLQLMEPIQRYQRLVIDMKLPLRKRLLKALLKVFSPLDSGS